jgi:hypothetical protein
LFGTETWTFRTEDQEHLESFEVWCWPKIEICWTDRIVDEEILHRVKEERNILHTTTRKKASWIGHILRRNCLKKLVIERKREERLEMERRRGRRLKQLRDGLKERKGYSKLKDASLDRTL